MIGPCSYGIENDFGICQFLLIHEDGTTSCKLLIEGKVKPEDIGIGKGCILRSSPEIYNYYKNRFEEVHYGENAME